MKIFDSLYQKILIWSQHRHATRYLAGISFAESSVFPLPPDLMLIPMVLAKQENAWHYALITTIASIFGGVVGYLLGFYLIEVIEPVLIQLGYWPYYLQAAGWVQSKGIILLLIAGVLPIPYKFFTLSAGALHIAFLPFLVASAVGRFIRFYLVSALLVWKGEWLQKVLLKYIEYIGWGSLLVMVAIVAFIW